MPEQCRIMMGLAVVFLALCHLVSGAQPRHQGSTSSCPTPAVLDAAVRRFSRLLQFQTVSDRDARLHVLHEDQFTKLHAFLAESYPEVHKALTVEQVGEGNLSLLLTWPGSAPELKPLLFISHLDVVPVAEETLSEWTYPPFSGAIAEGFVWGRGALDVKIGVIGLLEAVTALLASGWAPRRTLLLAFGQDEEVGGDLGAGSTAALLVSRGITELDAVIDEGSVVMEDGFAPYITNKPIALISTAEKGYYSVQVQVHGQGGHSSVPPIAPGRSAPAQAGMLLVALDTQPMRGALVPPVTDMLRAMAPLVDKPWLQTLFADCERPEYAERILNGHLLVDTPMTAALAHTTTAVTGVQGYVGDNVLPPSVTVTVNSRLLPGDTVESVMAHLQGLVTNLGINATFHPVRPDVDPEQALATPVTSASGRHFTGIKQALQEGWQGAVPGQEGPLTVVPYLMSGGTDSRHYLKLSTGGVLRFVPTGANQTAGDMARIHGLNERLSITGLGRAMCTYMRVVQLLADE
mmetsp:Transcript_2492/g.4194  ORF Transcript_2492/g.4194 Transcript_2492/m.4194 type:complete len:520 (+) Transcript_2492:3-1562(+)